VNIRANLFGKASAPAIALRRNARSTASRPESHAALALRQRVNLMIEQEIQRCRARLGEDAWEQHGAWVTANIVEAAKLWLMRRAERGEL
jgi:hypothetical protein